MTRVGIFIYNIVAIFLLAALGVWYVSGLGDDYTRVTLTPHWFDHLFTMFRFPLRCAWFGALGGVVISLKGVYDHASTGVDGWQSRYNLWHFGRPLSGAITGLITYLLLKAVNPTNDPSEPILYAAAFILGTQERRFFDFLYEVARIVVQVPKEQETAGLKVTAIEPAEGQAADVVVLRGQGFLPGVTVKLGNAALAKISVSSDGAAIAGLVPAGTPGKADVVVANPDGTTVVLHDKFTYRP